jgi:hypothetical protein
MLSRPPLFGELNICDFSWTPMSSFFNAVFRVYISRKYFCYFWRPTFQNDHSFRRFSPILFVKNRRFFSWERMLW